MIYFLAYANDKWWQYTKNLLIRPIRLWVLVVFFCLAFVFQVVHTRDVSAEPPPYRVGACLSGQVTLGRQHNESPEQLYQRTINELKNIANAIQQNVPNGSMEVYPILPAEAHKIPSPPACVEAYKKSGDNYDIWLNLTLNMYEKSTQKASFLCEVTYWKNGELKTPLTGVFNGPEAVQQLTKTGLDIVARPVQLSPDPVDLSHAPSRGIIFVYDSSGSMRLTDYSAKNRLGVLTTIADIIPHIAQTGAQPMPFAIVVFAHDAEALDSKPGLKWFQMTPSDVDVAYKQLKSKLTDKKGDLTNIEAAFKEVKLLIDSRKDIERWNVVFLTDGFPTIGIQDYGQLTRLVTDALGGKSTLNVVALYGKENSYTLGAKLQQLVGVIKNDTGLPGDVVNLKEGDDLDRFRGDIANIALLINQSTLLGEANLICVYDPGIEHEKCKLDESKPHPLSLGAVPKVKFIAETTAFNVGKCIAEIQNQALGAKPLTIELLEGQSEKIQEGPAFKIILARGRERGRDRVYLTVDMTRGKLNGDWKVKLDIDGR